MVADIARQHLTNATKQQLRALLGNDDLAAISTWADDIRSQRPETYGWHFVDIPMTSPGFSQSRDCYRFDEKHPQANNDHHNCVVDRIAIFEQVLADRSASQADRVEALKFLVHFVGDVHQPLHAIGEARGGNDINVVEFGSPQCGTRPCNLHYAWDLGLIDHAGKDEPAYVSYLQTVISQRRLERSAGRSPADWANESFRLAHQIWLPSNGQVDQAYYEKNIEIVNERLALAGLRLARLLNQALGN